LLEHLEATQEEDRLHQLLNQGTPITFELASDGGAREDLGSFGWTIAVERNTLWTCKGPTYGILPGSFRAESYGMSALLFLDTYITHFNTQLDRNTKLKFYCGSSLLLKRITRAQNQAWINPTNCLASDYDLESGILDILKKIPIEIICIHVKSHQDNKTEVHLLLWEAQMNVQADHLATDYLDNYAEPSKIIPFIPPSQASLTIKGQTITRRFAKQLRLEASSPDLRKRMIITPAASPTFPIGRLFFWEKFDTFNQG
jgi:hypothetical protein